MRLAYRLFLSLSGLLVFTMPAPDAKATETPVRERPSPADPEPPKPPSNHCQENP